MPAPRGPWKVFWLEPTDEVEVSLRRFTFSSAGTCPARPDRGCDARVLIADREPFEAWKTRREDGVETVHREIPEDDPRWPSRCEACGRELPESATRQVWAKTLHRGAPDGRLYTIDDAPVGAMWDADWLPEEYAGPDGIRLTVRTPGGDWHVDSTASNCTRRREPHACWVRHGDPRTGQVHVDKNGNTCSAGAGSIGVGDYHGFLHHGHLTAG